MERLVDAGRFCFYLMRSCRQLILGEVRPKTCEDYVERKIVKDSWRGGSIMSLQETSERKFMANTKNTNTARMVKFRDVSGDEHFGMLLKNNSLVCFCCGGMLKSKEYRIVQEYDMDWAVIDNALKEMMG